LLLHRLGREIYADRVLLTAAAENAPRKVKPLLAAAKRWRKQTFPLRGSDVVALGLAPGPEIGRLLAELEAAWEASDFKATRRVLLAELRRRATVVAA
jgi:poly(A) polymerase